MIVRPEKNLPPEIKVLHLTYASYQKRSFPLWRRAILWERETWLYEGDISASSQDFSLLLFCPENQGELWQCLVEAFHFQQGEEEVEWVMLAIHALRCGIDKDFLTTTLSSSLPLTRLSDMWNWALEHEALVSLAVQYRISLRLIYDWRKDTSWLNWIREALPLLHANGNQLRQIRQGFLSLINNNSWSLEDILEKIHWHEIATAEEPPVKKLETLNARLKHLRYPHFITSEAQLKQLSLFIRQKTGWTLAWPLFLEGDTITLSISLKKPADINNIPHHISAIQQYCLHSLEILRGKFHDSTSLR